MQVGVGVNLSARAPLGGVPVYPIDSSISLMGGSLPAGLSFARSSSATYFDVSGAMQLASANTPRFDYDPYTHQLLGLMQEGQIANILLNSLLNGTSLSTQTVTVTSGFYWTLSFYGSGTVTLSGAQAATVVGSNIPTELTQYVFSPAAGSLTLTVSGTVKWAQLENNYGATSFIPTAGAPVTRQPDIINFTGTNLSILQGAVGAAVVQCVRRAQQAFNGSIVGPNTVNAIYLSDAESGGNARLNVFGGATRADAGIRLAVGRIQRIGAAWRVGNHAACVDGYTVGTGTNATAIAQATTYSLGSNSANGSGSFNGWFQSVDLYTHRISNSQLQAACALAAPTWIGSSQPKGAAQLSYNTKVVDLSPTTSDIAPGRTGSFALFDDMYFSGNTPDKTPYSMTNGVLTIPLNKTVCTQTRDSTQGTLPYLSGATGFYAEFDVWLSDNSQDHWPAVWLMPWEHDLAFDDHYAGDPAGYERWMELDVDEGGFGKNTTASVIDWQGTYDGATGKYWRDSPTNTVAGNISTNQIANGYLDRTQKHTFGVSYEAATGFVRWYLDDIQIFKATAPAIAAQQHFYLIANAQTHGLNAAYNMYLSRMRAYTP